MEKQNNAKYKSALSTLTKLYCKTKPTKPVSTYVSLAPLFGSHGKKRILSNVNNCFSVTRRAEKEQMGVCVDILEHDMYRHFSTREDSGVNVNTNIYEWLCAHLRH